MSSRFCVVTPCSPLGVTNIKGKGSTNVKTQIIPVLNQAPRHKGTWSNGGIAPRITGWTQSHS